MSSQQNNEHDRPTWQERDPEKVIAALKTAGKKALFVAQPFKTHVIPQAPIAQAFQQRGYEVAVVSPDKKSQRDAARNYRLPYIPAGSPWSDDPEAQARLGRLRVEEGNDAFCKVLYGEYFAPAARAMYPELKRIVEEIGIENVHLVADCSDFATKMVGDALGIPVTTFDNGLVRNIMENWTEHIRPVVNEVRAEFGLPPEPEERPAGYDNLYTPTAPELLLSGLDLPEVVGYQREIAKRMGEGLPEGVFESDRPKVYAMLGSSANEVAAFGPLFEHANIETIKALTAGGYDALISVASAELVEKYSQYAGPNVKVVAYADQPAALAAADVYIGHGGFGGLGEMLKGRTPAVILPHFADQPDNAKAIEEGGMGLAFADSREATAESIREKIDQIIAHPEIYLAAVNAMQDRVEALPALAEVIDEIAGPVEHPGGAVAAVSSAPANVITVALPEETLVEEPEIRAEDLEAPVEDLEAPVEDLEDEAFEGKVLDGEIVEGEVLDDRGAVVEVEAPAAEVEVEAPAEVAETPAAEVEAPADEFDAPADELEQPAEVEAPAVEIEQPADRDLEYYDPYDGDWF